MWAVPVRAVMLMFRPSAITSDTLPSVRSWYCAANVGHYPGYSDRTAEPWPCGPFTNETRSL